ncbi:hypothetical protein N658DRAFT_299956 [Parathielavia hyrcaniae]|uniref:Uncharacterized protein n=1 Tax=Parathielavia hyrcaniae TaxID=113614 RepID=A0AAN6Q3S6_9PEZI|nr:hypothetical protein N658DRAFT_299956 [Parathielavia hyrcaniae]
MYQCWYCRVAAVIENGHGSNQTCWLHPSRCALHRPAVPFIPLSMGLCARVSVWKPGFVRHSCEASHTALLRSNLTALAAISWLGMAVVISQRDVVVDELSLPLLGPCGFCNTPLHVDLGPCRFPAVRSLNRSPTHGPGNFPIRRLEMRACSSLFAGFPDLNNSELRKAESRHVTSQLRISIKPGCCCMGPA